MPAMALVLLADRDADTRLMYAEHLRQLAYEIDDAEDGREALAKAISRRPAVVVTETRLPGISGFELCRLLRHDPLTETIPIVVVTGRRVCERRDARRSRRRRRGAGQTMFTGAAGGRNLPHPLAITRAA